MAPFAPVSEVPTIALVVDDRLFFDVVTLCLRPVTSPGSGGGKRGGLGLKIEGTFGSGCRNRCPQAIAKFAAQRGRSNLHEHVRAVERPSHCSRDANGDFKGTEATGKRAIPRPSDAPASPPPMMIRSHAVLPIDRSANMSHRNSIIYSAGV